MQLRRRCLRRRDDMPDATFEDGAPAVPGQPQGDQARKEDSPSQSKRPSEGTRWNLARLFEASVGKVRWPFLLLLGTLWVLLVTWGQSEYNLQQSFQVSQLIVANVFTGKTGMDPCSGHAVNEILGSPKAVENETVLVTGGSGFIGSHLVEMLLELGYTVRVYDNLETGNLLFLNLRHPRLHFVYGDIMDMDSMRTAMVGVRGVFHLGAASKVLPSLKNPAMGTFNVEKNSVGTSRVLEAANETMMVRKVLYAASSTYYGNQAVPFTETDPFMPTSPYAASKYMGELIMLTNDNLYKLPTLSLRFFMVYGPRNPAQGAYAIVTGKFIDRLKNGQPLIIEGDGQNFRDFVHVNDVARALILGYQSDIHGTSINIGSGEKHSVKEVADLISSNQQHVAARKNDLLGTLADTCRARSTLNFQSRHDFIATMKVMIEDALAGRSDYFAPMWGETAVEDALEKMLPGWKSLTGPERNARLKSALAANRSFQLSLHNL
mgnify:CR=1 FL=1